MTPAPKKSLLHLWVMLHNLKFIRPIIATYVISCYSTLSRLFIADGGVILSSEWTT